MLDFFANFIKTGDPSGEGGPQWPTAEAKADDPMIMVIDTESKAVPAAHDKRYEFLDKKYTEK